MDSIGPIGDPVRHQRFANPLVRAAFVVAGLAAVGVGIAGIAIPGLPGTPFLLIAAWLFARSNERLHRWMLTNRWFGQAIADYQAGLGISRRIKRVAVASVVVVVSLSVGVGIDTVWLRVLVAALGMVGVGFILTRPTRDLLEA